MIVSATLHYLLLIILSNPSYLNQIRSLRSLASWSRGENEQLPLVTSTLSTR
ncbi:hypothetical protein AVEN_85687-1, partial [Araneus ventricosus]